MINVGIFAEANQPQFFQVHLLDQALQSFITSPQITSNYPLQLSETVTVAQISEICKTTTSKLDYKTGNAALFGTNRSKQHKLTLIQYLHQFHQQFNQTAELK